MSTRRSQARGRDHSSTRRMAARLKREADVCALCGRLIDKELKSPDPWSFTVDHVVPLSMGGSPNDPANARAAHRLCNMKRGTGRGRPSTPDDRSAGW